MKAKIFLVYFLIILKIDFSKGRSEEFYKCINPQKTVISSSDCTSIKIPESEGYKCCSMIITHNNNSSYSCLTLENKYALSKETLKEYISKNNVDFLFTSVGGKMEIECGDNDSIIENYEKKSDEYLNCYNNHIIGIENENECTKNDIPKNEGSKCCFVETSAENNNGNIITDKRCYVIKDEYFTKNNNLSNFILNESNSNNLDEIGNTNVTISCKNYDKFVFSVNGKNKDKTLSSDEINNNAGEIVSDIISITDISKVSDSDKNSDIEDDEYIQIDNKNRNKKSGLKAWAIILIVVGSVILVGIIIFLVVFCYCRKRKNQLEINKTTEIVDINTNSKIKV